MTVSYQVKSMSALADAATVGASKLVSDRFGVFFLAFVISLLVTPLMRWLAVRNGIIDQPDLNRKNHLEPVAYLGGVGLFLAWLGGLLLGWLVLPGGTERGTPMGTGVPLPMVFGATVIMLTGLIDDVYGISPRVKIGGQFMAAAALSLSSQNLGVKLVQDTLAWVGVSPPFLLVYVLGGTLIALFVVGGCNSMNLLDGLDGLAAGVAGIAGLGLLMITVTTGANADDPGRGGAQIANCMAMLGAVLGFLPYNFNPANIFMGDAGSLLLGYLCVSTILLFADAPSGGPVLVTAALIVYALPITDMFVTIFRRTLRGQPLSTADKGHLHHKVLAVIRLVVHSPNLSVKLAVLVMYGLAAFFSVLGYSLVFLRWRYVLAAFFSVFGFILVRAYKSARREAILAAAGSVGSTGQRVGQDPGCAPAAHQAPMGDTDA